MTCRVATRVVLISVAAFATAVVPAAQARPCSTAAAAGTWGFNVSGTFFFPNAVPIVNVGVFTTDAAGNLTGSQTRNVGGDVGTETVTGTLSLNPDCTGTVTAHAFDPSTGAPEGIAVTAIVMDDNLQQLRTVITQEFDNNGIPFPGVVSGVGERVFAQDKDQEGAGGCTLGTLKGAWGSAINGTIVGVGPIAVLGIAEFDGQGHFSMNATAVVESGAASEQTTGTYTVNQDCTGTTMDDLGDSTYFVILGDGTQVIAVSTKSDLVGTLQLTKESGPAHREFGH
jgi:hypothetical protein